MSVFSIWESRFPPAAAAEGREATEAIWRDMPGFDGYLRHVLVEDLDEPGHLLVVGEWESRETADRAATSTPTRWRSRSRLASIYALTRPRLVPCTRNANQIVFSAAVGND